MTNTTETKAYCMNCDVLVHIPTEIPYTGRAKEDEFIGCPGALLKENRKDFAATLGPDALLMTWKDGKAFRMEKVPYRAITGLDTGERRQSEVASLGSAAGAALGAGLAFGALSLVEQALTHVKTLKVKTAQKEYEIWIPQAPEWADRIRDQLVTNHPQRGALRLASTEPARTSGKAQPVPSTKFCRECGVKIPRDSTYCEECGKNLG